jgi:GH25 family lysozyme M1 (1,4-beta-N-acetylmuramidase)
VERRGIDVSKWNGRIDWKKVKESGINFAIVRIGYGASLGDNCVVDPMFNANIDGALAAGIDVGVYLYSYAKSVPAVIKEANFVIAKLQPYRGKLSYPVTFDLEDVSQKGLGRELLTDMVIAFCTTIQKAGFFANLYSNLDWCRNRLDMNKLQQLDLWLANWSSRKPTSYPFGMWQFTDAGIVPGINGKVDMNIAYKDYPGIIRGVAKPQIPVDRGDDRPATPTQPTKPTLRIDSRGEFVVELQKKLNALNLNVGKVDGVFGKITQDKVIAFQKARNLVPDGVVGEKTHKALDEVLATSTPKPQNGRLGIVTASALNIRQKPSITASKVGFYKQGEKITILNEQNGWYLTDKGFVSKQYVKLLV